MRRSHERHWCAGSAVLSVFMASSSHAQDVATEQVTAVTASTQGAFLPWSVQTNHANQRGTVQTTAGFDTATARALFRGEANASVVGVLGVRAGVSYDGMGPSAHPLVGGWLDALSQKHAGLDLSLHARFESDGFNMVPAVAGGVALARSFGDLNLLMNAEYGHGVHDDERSGTVSFAAVERLSSHFGAGVDSRFQIDLERDSDEPENELDWRLLAGPLALASFGAFSISAGGGVSALRYRLSPVDHVGAALFGGLGAVF